MATTEFAKPDKSISLKQLAGEIAALSLPNYVGLEMHEVRRGATDSDSVTPPFIAVVSDALSNSQKSSVTTAIANHAATTTTDIKKTAYAALSDTAAKTDYIAELLGIKDP
tara:strand:- start:353 stop:685 length:333 start_codon:yes stop_codon:yes gene_type:complete